MCDQLQPKWVGDSMVIYPHVVIQLTLSENDVDTLSAIFKRYKELAATDGRDNLIPSSQWILMNDFKFSDHYSFNSERNS